MFDDDSRPNHSTVHTYLALLVAVLACAGLAYFAQPTVHVEHRVVDVAPAQECNAYCSGRESSVFALDPDRHVCVCADGAAYDTAHHRPRDPLLTYDLFCNRFDITVDYWVGRD